MYSVRSIRGVTVERDNTERRISLSASVSAVTLDIRLR